VDGEFDGSTSTERGSRPVGFPGVMLSSGVVVCDGERRRESAGGLSSSDVDAVFDGPGTGGDA